MTVVPKTSPWSRVALLLATVIATLPIWPATAAEKPVRPALEGYLKQLGYGVIPLRRSEGNQFHVDGRLGERKRVFMVDTGFTWTTLDAASARELKTPKEMGVVLEDPEFGKVPEDSVVLIPELTVGPARFANQFAKLMRFGTFTYDYHGVIGIDFMRRHHSLLDCLDGRLYVRARPATAEVRTALENTLRKNGYQEVPLTVHKSLVLVAAAEINGKTLNLMVDTGASFTLLDDKAASECGLHWEKTYSAVAGVGKIGTSRVLASSIPNLFLNKRKFPVSNLAIGGAKLDNWKIGDKAEFSDIQGTLGADLLASGQVLIDVAQKKLWFLPEEEVKAVGARGGKEKGR